LYAYIKARKFGVATGHHIINLQNQKLVSHRCKYVYMIV